MTDLNSLGLKLTGGPAGVYKLRFLAITYMIFGFLGRSPFSQLVSIAH